MAYCTNSYTSLQSYTRRLIDLGDLTAACISSSPS